MIDGLSETLIGHPFLGFRIENVGVFVRVDPVDGFTRHIRVGQYAAHMQIWIEQRHAREPLGVGYGICVARRGCNSAPDTGDRPGTD